ncbi:uncharacterized protein LOC130761647 [Actinidia eriantha]|uniref:uncharacterized protein LOC130761647 n=1 Tax=Actinidia eriantha TaxID=165200 RepID=UPI00258717D6|nr:uncharacterized protein LOC130761647 [Actinidia eriantha]
MTRLMRKGICFVWNDTCEHSFQELKKKLTSSPILVIPERGLGYTVYCDASRDGLGCMLMQSQELEVSIHIERLKLEAATLEYMEYYNFKLHYHPGKANIVADAFSRKSPSTLASISIHEWQMLQDPGEYDLLLNETASLLHYSCYL